MSNTSNNKTANSKPTKSKDKDKLRVIVGEIGRDSKTGILGRGYSSDNGKTFHVTDTMYGRLYDPNDIEGIWNGGTADKVKKEVDSATAEIPAAVSAANSAVSAAESAVAASKVNSDAIVAQSEAISEAKSAMDSATAEIQQTAANAASDAAKIRADVAQVQNEVDTAKTANSASVEALKSDVSAAKQDLADVHDSLDKAQSAIEQNQKLINYNVAKITSDVSATKQDLATVHDSLTKAQAAAEQNQKAIDKSIAQINANVDATNQDLAGIRKGLTKAQSDITANQKAVNDNVAQINSDIEQDRKDIASAQQANADTVKQLDAYSKQAQDQGKTIKSVQDKQDGFTATLADVQGNVSQVSDKIDGLSASLKDTQGNVASVKAQADQLSATLTDHAKSIATLTASAKELSSTLEDADGRLSKVEQTAQTNSSTLSDVQGDLSQVKQNATKLVSTLKDAQGNISTLQQKADSLSTQLASAQGDIATLQTGIDGVKATLTSHDKSIHTLQADSKSLKDSMVNAQGDISTLRKTATDVTSELEDHTGRLSKVEQSAAKQATTLSDLQGNLSQVEQTADGLTDTLKDAQGDITKVQATAKGLSEQITTAQGAITDLQTDVTGVKATIADHDKNIHTLQADSKSLTDSMTDAQGNISKLQKTAESVESSLEDASGRLSKVEQTAKEHTSTLSDLQGNLSQVKQTADGIETTLKSAQGDIDQIKQTAKGTSEQLADVQGNITNIQKDVNGLKQTTADNAGNIHTLQSDSKSLHDSMQDAQGDISTLKKTSTDVTSELKDHAGRISKAEQTASTLVNEFADQQGHLNRVEQTANGTQQTVANQQGQINNIKTDAAGIHETLTGQGNQIANINVTLSGLNTKYEGVSGDLGKLKAQTDWKIVTGVLDANQYTKTAKIFYQDMQAKNTPNVGWFYLIVDAPRSDRITQTLIRDNTTDTWTRVYNGAWWQAWTKGANNLDVAKLSDRITTNSTQITQNQQAIALKADQSTVNSLSGEVSQNKAQLQVQADQISSKVSSTDFTALNDRTMQDRGTVTSPDFNSLTQAGYYTVTNPTNGKNYPIGNWGTLEVSGQTSDSNGRLNQKYVSDNNAETYVRQYNAYAKTWTAWIKTANQNDINTLNGKITKNSTAIDQTNKQISLKADQTEVDKVKGTASQNSSRLDVMANEISSKVTSTDVNNIVDKKGYATTSTVQSLITQKAGTISESITNLTNKVNSNNGGGVNLLQGTAKCEFSLNSHGGTQTVQKYDDETNYIQHTSNTPINRMGPWFALTPEVGQVYTFSADVAGNGYITGDCFRYEGSDSSTLSRVDLTDNWQRISNTFRVNTITGWHNWIIYANNSTLLKVKHIKIERGSVATPWTPAPSDNATVTQVQQITASIDGLQSTVANKADKSQITQLSNVIQSKVSSTDFNNLRKAVDLQTLDSADINNMKTNGHYFVRNLANNPVGGWVYVDVTGNGADRIRQDVYQDSGNQHKYRRWFGDHWTSWDEGASYSEITQLRDDINLRVKKGDLLSQINIDAGHTLIQSNKIYLAAGNVAFSDSAFIPSAAIENLDASKLTFYGPYNTYATIGSSVKQYDDDKLKNTINLQYNGGVEVHAANELGSILTMHDDTIRLAVKSQVYGSGSGQPLNQQYSGVWFGSNYTLMNTVDKEGKTTGWAIGSNKTGVNNDYRAYLYDNSTSVQPNYGVGIGTTRFDVYAGNSQLFLGPDKAELRSSDYATLHGNNSTYVEGGDQQMYMHNGEVNIGNPNNIGSATGVHLQVFGWATFNGYVEAMGFNTKSTLSSKTRITPLDTADALDKITSTDLTTFQYKTEVAEGFTKRHAGPIIDDVNDVAQYRTPDAFVSENRQGRSDADIIGYLMGAVQELKKQLDKVKEQVNNG